MRCFVCFWRGGHDSVSYTHLDVYKRQPLDRLLIETDSPYLAPVPHRGERNDSTLVRLTCERLAEIKGVSFDEMARLTCRNACELFAID